MPSSSQEACPKRGSDVTKRRLIASGDILETDGIPISQLNDNCWWNNSIRHL